MITAAAPLAAVDTAAETETKVFKVRIRGALADVWREITKTDEVQKVMFNMRLDSTLEVGAKVFMRSPDGKTTGIVGEVLAFEPMRKYAHTFKFTSYDEAACTVVHTLDEDGDEVVYTMMCEGMVKGDQTTKQMTQGGDLIVKNLKAIIETGALPFGTRALYLLFALTAPFAPKKLRSENWQ